MVTDATVEGFAQLFRGLPTAYGLGSGGWVHAPTYLAIYRRHLQGQGSGIGIGPLLADGTCWFAAIDLDRPDFALAKEMMKLLPGYSWLERSRSGNAHVLVFFHTPIEAWVARGLMREVLAALGERSVEVFPKSHYLQPGMVGNYLNLPYFGDTRRVIAGCQKQHIADYDKLSVEDFVDIATHWRNDPADWRKRAHWLGVVSPQERAAAGRTEFGQAPNLHQCAAYVIEHRDDNPVVQGHRAVVYFALSKMLLMWSEIDYDEALGMLTLVNDSSPDPISTGELRRILSNAARGKFTSTSCDDPLFIRYADPDCPIAHAR